MHAERHEHACTHPQAHALPPAGTGTQPPAHGSGRTHSWTRVGTPRPSREQSRPRRSPEGWEAAAAPVPVIPPRGLREGAGEPRHVRAPGPRLPAAAAAPARSCPAPLRSGAVAVAEHAWGGGGGGTVPQAAPPAAAPPVCAPHRHHPLRCWGPGCPGGEGGVEGNLVSSPRRCSQPGDPTALGPHPHPHLPIVRSSPARTPTQHPGAGMALVPPSHPAPTGHATPGYGGARGRRPLGPWHEPRGAVLWVAMTATQSSSPSYLVMEMSTSPPGITAGPPAPSRCPLHPAAASPKDGDVRVPSAAADGNEEGFCSALARGEDGEGRTSPSPSRQRCLCSRAQALSNSFPRTPARAAGGKAAREHRLGAHSPPRGPACPQQPCRASTSLPLGCRAGRWHCPTHGDTR